jgi:hypothetical protein
MVMINGRTPSFSAMHRLWALASLLVVSGSLEAFAAGKPSTGTSSPCNAEFRTSVDTVIEGVVTSVAAAIVDEGKGVYRHGVDGTRCQVDSIEKSTGADLLFTTNHLRSKTRRSTIVKLDNPAAGSISKGVWNVTQTFHLHIHDFGAVPVGTSILHRASFHIAYEGNTYKFRYQYEPEDGTVLCRITRVSSTVWTLESLDSHQARLWFGGSFGDPTVYPPSLGDYIAPFHLTITLQ